MRARTDLGFVDLLQPLQRLARVAGLLYMHVFARVQTRSLAPSLSIYQVPASLTYPPVSLVPLFTAATSTCLPTLTAQPTEQLTHKFKASKFANSGRRSAVARRGPPNLHDGANSGRCTSHASHIQPCTMIAPGHAHGWVHW